MRHNVCGGILVFALLAGAAGAAAAQETGTPIFKAPYRAFDHHELGVSLSDPGEGVSLALEGSNTTFVPYAHPVIVPTFGGGESDVNFALGLGVDIRFSEQWAIRASGGLGDIEGVGVSVAYIR